MKESK
jgi:hypothetical protein